MAKTEAVFGPPTPLISTPNEAAAVRTKVEKKREKRAKKTHQHGQLAEIRGKALQLKQGKGTLTHPDQ